MAGAAGTISKQGRAARLALAAMAGLVLLALPVSRAQADGCIPKLLQPPQVTKAVMLIPSKTEVLIKASFSGVEGCDSWQRLGKFRVQIKQRGSWVNLNGNFWYPTEGKDVPDKNEAHGFGFLDFATHDVHEQCVNGQWEPARVQFQNSVRNTGTGKIAARGKIKSHPIKIEPTTAC